MADITRSTTPPGELPAARRSRTSVGRTLLRLGLGLAAWSTGAGLAAAQDITNSGPFTNNATYTGEVLGNTGNIGNSLGAHWTGAVTNTGLVYNYGSWTGAIKTNGIGLTPGYISNSGAGALWTGSVTNVNGQITNQLGASWVGDIVYNKNVIFNKIGSTWRGDIVATGGGQIDNFGTWIGAVRVNDGSIYTENGSWTGDVIGNTGNIYNNYADSTQNPGGVHATVWNGDVLGNSALIINFALGVWNGKVAGITGDIANYGAWNGDLSTTGRIIHTGVWTGNVVNNGTYFHAQNQIIGNFDNRGALQLTGNLGGIVTLTNSGTLNLAYVAGAQTLSVGKVVFTPTSTFSIDVTAGGLTDIVVVGGAATLGGTVSVKAAAGSYASPTAYTILTAGSIDGAFAGVTTDLAFFAPHLTYDANHVYLTLKRNDLGLANIGTTANQRAVGAIVDSLGAGSPLYDAALWLTAQEAQQAFDDLSGEAYVSARTGFVQSSRLVRDAALGRLRDVFEAPPSGDGAASGYAQRPAVSGAPTGDAGFWTQFYGAVGITAATADTSRSALAAGGIALGLDGSLDDWRLGVMLDAGLSSNAVAALGSTIGSGDYGLGVYAGRQWGGTRVSLGAHYARHDIHSTRDVGFPGFVDTLTANYAGGTAQAFGEVSQEFDFGAVSLLPYLGLAYVHNATDGWVETGGPAALRGAAGVVDATFATLGVRAEQQFAVADTMLLTANGSLAWRHAFAGAQIGNHTLAGSAFRVAGAPIPADVIEVSAGLDLDVSETTKFHVTYAGQFSAGSNDHALRASWATAF